MFKFSYSYPTIQQSKVINFTKDRAQIRDVAVYLACTEAAKKHQALSITDDVRKWRTLR